MLYNEYYVIVNFAFAKFWHICCNFVDRMSCLSVFLVGLPSIILKLSHVEI